jgi:hypothetical protein
MIDWTISASSSGPLSSAQRLRLSVGGFSHALRRKGLIKIKSRVTQPL